MVPAGAQAADTLMFFSDPCTKNPPRARLRSFRL